MLLYLVVVISGEIFHGIGHLTGGEVVVSGIMVGFTQSFAQDLDNKVDVCVGRIQMSILVLRYNES